MSDLIAPGGAPVPAVTALPPGFTFGVATAAYQIEGAVAEGGRTPSIWDTFSHTPGRVAGGDTGDVACDHYHRVEEDVALMADLGIDAYRFSISWSRLVPGGTGPVNPEGVAFYRRLCERLRDAGITPFATLYHWDLPQALQDRGGWLSPASPGWFADYARAAKDALGDLVQAWTTLNEPWCSAFVGHADGEHAPGIADPGSGFVAAHHLLVGHHRAVEALRSTRPHPADQVGIVLNLIPAWPARDIPEDVRAASAVDLIQNRLFLGATFEGRYPEEVLALHRRFGVDDRIDLEALAAALAPIDYLGVNYYNVHHIAHVPGAAAPGPWPGADEAELATAPGELTEMGWGVQPEGLTWTLDRVTRAHGPIPVMVCENGAAYPDGPVVDGVLDDPLRIAYLASHLAAIGEAVEAGADVRGYFLWSLLDNFEWAHGYGKRFGIVHVDFETLVRTPKASAQWYRDQIAAHRRR